MRVLIGCEYSGAVRRAFRKLGHDAWSCDLLPAEDGSVFHIQGNVLDILGNDWDIGIFHPPCTRLCNSGVRWLGERNLWNEMKEAALFFSKLLDAPIPRVAVENPLPHHYALEVIGRRYDQIIQPWWFGHGEMKATCLWLRNLPPLMATVVHPSREQKIWMMPPTPDRGHERSRTYAGVARAMAEQWGGAQ